MTTDTEHKSRLTVRAPRPVVDELEEAASLIGVTVNQFVVQAASEKARAIIDSATRVQLSARDAVFIADLLDNPPAPSAVLKRVAARYKKVFLAGRR